MKLGKTG